MALLIVANQYGLNCAPVSESAAACVMTSTFLYCLMIGESATATPLDVGPIMKSTLSSRIYFFAIPTPTGGCIFESAVRSVTLRPSMPPEALISSTASRTDWKPCLP